MALIEAYSHFTVCPSELEGNKRQYGNENIWEELGECPNRFVNISRLFVLGRVGGLNQ